MGKNQDVVSKYLKLAEKEMLKLNHPYVGSEHMILALFKDDNIKEILNKYGLTYSSFKKELIDIIGSSNIKTTKILHTPLLKTIINDAKTDAKENNNGIVTPKHILISILENGDGIGLRILLSMGVDLEGIYKELKKEYNPLFNNLKKYGSNLNDSDSILIGRDEELNEIVEILLRKNKNNPLLIGDAGVGKTAIVEGLANRINSGYYKTLLGYKIFNLDLSLLLSGTKYRGDFEERLNTVIKEVIDNKKIILFIDEIHTIMKAGGSEGAIDAANILKPYLSKDKLKIIGATTREEYEKHISKDKALVRRFDVVNIKEPNIDETKIILDFIKNKYKNFYRISISNNNISSIIKYANDYLINKKNPDKSIDLLDSVCSYVKNKNKKSISDKDIKEVLSRKINRRFDIDIELIKKKIKSKIFGQDIVIDELIDIINSNKYKIILLNGGIGVGKTCSIKEISNLLDYNFVLFDMNEYNNYFSINNIYSGENSIYNKIGDNSIILFDNIEKCNQVILDNIINIISERKIRDKRFDNSIIFLSATDSMKYKIGFNKGYLKIKYNNKRVLENVDYIINYNDINYDAINKYVKNNNIKDFNYSDCDFTNFGFRAVKLCINSKNLVK